MTLGSLFRKPKRFSNADSPDFDVVCTGAAVARGDGATGFGTLTLAAGGGLGATFSTNG
jgi:hypothetical protein